MVASTTWVEDKEASIIWAADSMEAGISSRLDSIITIKGLAAVVISEAGITTIRRLTRTRGTIKADTIISGARITWVGGSRRRIMLEEVVDKILLINSGKIRD